MNDLPLLFFIHGHVAERQPPELVTTSANVRGSQQGRVQSFMGPIEIFQLLDFWLENLQQPLLNKPLKDVQ
jgi:hypothetical protein